MRNTTNPNQLRDNIELIDLNKLLGFLYQNYDEWDMNCKVLKSEASELVIYGEEHATRHMFDYHYSDGVRRGYEDLINAVKNEYYERFFPNLKDL